MCPQPNPVRSLAVSTGLCLAFASTLPSGLAPQEPGSDALLNERIRLTLTQGRTIEGTLRVAEPGALVIRSGSGAEERIALSEVLTVERSLGIGRQTRSGLLWGGGLGLAAGGLFGLWFDDEICGSCDGDPVGAFAAFGGGGGISFQVRWRPHLRDSGRKVPAPR